MAAASFFDERADEYDRWYDEHEALYRAELQAVRAELPPSGPGLEIGVGTGRFAAPLGAGFGIYLSLPMLGLADRRRVRVCNAEGERLPFRDGAFRFVLLVTVIAFLEDPTPVFREAHRVIGEDGRIVVAFIDGASSLGRHYSRREAKGAFRSARFCTPPEVAAWAKGAGFIGPVFRQTLIGTPPDYPEPQSVHDGFGEGGFVVLSAERARR